MNKYIEKELKEIQELQKIDDTHYYVPRVDASIEFRVDSSYIIKLKKYLIDEPENFTLSSNWNNGVKPISEYMKVCVNKIVGKMIRVDGYAYDNETKETSKFFADLWLPKGGVEIVTLLKDWE